MAGQGNHKIAHNGMELLHRPKKHSLTLKGHRTSVSLEDPFWNAFRTIAKAKQLALNELAAEIDNQRGLDCGLATAIRLYVLAYYQDLVKLPTGEI